jgi:biphenyl 2,3-dioxygenase ferredoxin subunit
MGLCKVSDVGSGKAIKIEKQGLTLAVFNVAFNIRTGEVVAPPCMIPLKTYKTYVENDEVGIELVESE